MEFIKRAWNYRLPAELARTVKGRAVRGMAWLLAVMICCTLVSRAADAVTIPVVGTAKPKSSVIVHTVTADGILETAGDTAVVATAGVMVKTVDVAVGDNVKEGDLLFTFDTKELSRQVTEKQLELTKLQTELRGIQESAMLTEEQKSLDRKRAEEDYDKAVDDAELNLRVAAEAVRTARTALAKYDGFQRSDYDEETFTEAEYDALRAAFREKTLAYEQAEAERDSALQAAKRKVDDTEKPAVDVTEETKRTDIQLKQLELNRLYEGVANGGQVFAPCDGIVTKLGAKVGTLTGSDASVYLSGEAAMNFVAEIDKDEKKYVDVGSDVTVSMGDSAKDSYDAKVTAVEAVAEKIDAYRVTVELAAEGLRPGASGTAVIRKSSGNYSTCIPLSALYGGDNRFYVLAVREVETALGTEYIADKIDVDLQEKNESSAAVSGAISSDSMLVTETAKIIGDGDRVRPETKA